ncbi:hypothetical protein V1J52_04015 [Streptomyces sp. TRM 70351]|uniref:hypothetical protein n=1 Tax=Streptomyces sp. TRM 70351 TaxID=3116552 RepID=UPI002E7BD0C4|nr:hypothetical protein [Streptomyces sp. TRM 70351]MEE1927355.1 hypothetical protein [Streptomyces sp. TRM 70351]
MGVPAVLVRDGRRVSAVAPPVSRALRRLVVTGRVVCVCRPAPPRTAAADDTGLALVRPYVARVPRLGGAPPAPEGCGPW